MAQSVKDIVDRYRSGIQITLNITPFVPKAGTPFQWMPMARVSALKSQLALLKKRLTNKGIEVKSDSIEWSLVQGMLARGDSRLGPVIENMPKVTLSNWRKGLEKAGIDPESIHQQIPSNEPLPWVQIDSGTSIERLRVELERSYKHGN